MQILQTQRHTHNGIKMEEKPMKGNSSQKYFDKSAAKHVY